METSLKLYKFVDGVIDTPFPNESEQALLTQFTYSAKRMGGAPSISADLMHTRCLDKEFTNQVYATFKGERYFVRSKPSSSYSNTDSRYKHSLEMVSEREILETIYLFDVVQSDEEVDKPKTNDSNVIFYGDIHEFASRLNKSLQYSKVDYNVVVDSGVNSKETLIALKDQFIVSALQEIFKSYDLHYWFDGKTIHIGESPAPIDYVFEYGVNNALMSISKNNSNYKIVNRCSGRGSSKNIPYYYPNLSPYGEVECLLNGEVTEAITIVDYEKFSRCGVVGSLKYMITEGDAMSVFEKGKSDVDGEIVDKLLGYVFNVPVYEKGYYIPFFVEHAYERIVAGCSYDHEKYVVLGYNPYCYIVDADEIVVARVPVGSFEGINVKLKHGQYSAVFMFPRYQHTSESEALNAAIMYLASYYRPEDIRGWFLNGIDYTSLASIGVQYVGTPQEGDEITFRIKYDRIPVIGNLMPSIYRSSKGTERFYNAINGLYENEETDGFYAFENPYVDGDPREHIEDFEDIFPTIEGMLNGGGQRIDEILEFAYDENDNDDIEETGDNLQHPYFYAKLRRFDGDNGFNLFAHAIEGEGMSLSMKSGNCGGCEWKVAVDDETKLNSVQVYEEDTTDDDGTFHARGSLKRLSNGKVALGSPQDIQNDTRYNEVWIALEKEDSTFGVLMPNSTNQYKPTNGDRFVILNISLPQSYIEHAEDRLSKEIVKYMAQNNSEKFSFDVKLSSIFLAENPNMLGRIDENSSLLLKYNGDIVDLWVSSYQYKITDGSPLPEVVVDLADEVSIPQSAIKATVDAAEARIVNVINNIDIDSKIDSLSVVRANRSNVLLKRNTFVDVVSFSDNVESSGFVQDPYYGLGWGVYKDENGQTILEVDKIYARHSLNVNELVVQRAKAQKGKMILSCGGCKIESIEEFDEYYRCYYDNGRNTDFSGFAVGDQAICQMFDGTYANIIRYYWRLVVGVGQSYVDLSKVDFDGNDHPVVGDTVVQLGNRNDVDRQSAIVIESIPTPSITQYVGINTFALKDYNIVTRISPGDSKFTGKVAFEAGSYGLENIEEWAEKQGLIDSANQNAADALQVASEAEENANSYTDGAISKLVVSGQNLLANSGFTGDYISTGLEPDDLLSSDSEMFSSKLAHWDNNNVVIQESVDSQSGYEASLTDGYLKQTLFYKIIEGESYVLSFKAKGNAFDVSVGGFSRRITPTTEYVRYVEKFIAQSSDSLFAIENATCTICEIQLERGTMVSEWGNSPLDNSSGLAYYQATKYLTNALKNGSTQINGGLLLSNMMMLGNTSPDINNTITSGVSGIKNDDTDVAFWGGGTYEQAIATILKYVGNPSYQPSEEEWGNMAKFVVTHGGDVFMRGYIHALGGYFSGEVNIAGGKIKLNQDGSGHLANGRYSWDENGATSISYPDAIKWIDGLPYDYETRVIDLTQGGFFRYISAQLTEEHVILPTPSRNTCIRFRTAGHYQSRNGSPFYITGYEGTMFRSVVENMDYGASRSASVFIINNSPEEATVDLVYDGTYWQIEKVSNASIHFAQNHPDHIGEDVFVLFGANESLPESWE